MTALQKEIWKSILRMFNMFNKYGTGVYKTKDIPRSKSPNSQLVGAIGL
jgi:hypothetical protein